MSTSRVSSIALSTSADATSPHLQRFRFSTSYPIEVRHFGCDTPPTHSLDQADATFMPCSRAPK